MPAGPCGLTIRSTTRTAGSSSSFVTIAAGTDGRAVTYSLFSFFLINCRLPEGIRIVTGSIITGHMESRNRSATDAVASVVDPVAGGRVPRRLTNRLTD